MNLGWGMGGQERIGEEKGETDPASQELCRLESKNRVSKIITGGKYM